MTTDTTVTAAIGEIRPSAEERATNVYAEALDRCECGDLIAAILRKVTAEHISIAYRDGYTAALSALSPLIEAAREVDRTWPEYVPNMDFVLALAELRAALSTFPAPASPSRFVDIVFDGPPSHESGRFVEVESPPGTSIRFGEWLQRDDGYWVLRFAAPPTTSDRGEPI